VYSLNALLTNSNLSLRLTIVRVYKLYLLTYLYLLTNLT